MKYDFADGKYSIIDDNGELTAFRNGEPWDRVLVGDALVYWMLVKIDQLDADSVTNIMLDVVPGSDGMGHEVYAKSVGDVVNKLTELDARLEEAEGDVASLKRTLRQTEETCPGLDGHVIALNRITVLENALREITELHGHWTNGMWAAKVAHKALGADASPTPPPQQELGNIEAALRQARMALMLAEPYVDPNTIANNKLYDALGEINIVLKATQHG